MVVASSAPFRIIFANAAVSGMHGRPCHEISGQHLSRILVLTKTTSKFKASFGEERVVELRKYAGTSKIGKSSSSNSSEHVSCRMKISPILSDINSTNSDPKACITHLCVDLIPQDDGHSNNLSEDNVSLLQPQHSHIASGNYQPHNQVMG
jgi:hypothetical protein